MEIREAGPAISILPGLHRDKLFRSERLRRVRLHSFHLSAALPTREATIWEWKSGKPARQYLSCPAFIETNFSDRNGFDASDCIVFISLPRFLPAKRRSGNGNPGSRPGNIYPARPSSRQTFQILTRNAAQEPWHERGIGQPQAGQTKISNDSERPALTPRNLRAMRIAAHRRFVRAVRSSRLAAAID